MPSTDTELITRAKREIDLPSFLAAYGWRGVAGKDTARHRLLAGPSGERILVARAANNHWVWRDTADPKSRGTIIDACRVLLRFSVGQTYGHLRHFLQTPPPVLPVAGRNARAVAQRAERPSRILSSLSEAATAYLIGKRGLDHTTLAAFSHRLHSNCRGHMVAPHNAYGDGEERGDGWKSFVGSQADGDGRGRSVWYACPKDGQPPTNILVAECAIDAMSAWEQFDPILRFRTMLISTAGSMSQAGADKLSRIVNKILGRLSCYGDPGEVTLTDASDMGESGTAQRESMLNALAEKAGLKYIRMAPIGAKDWNESLLAAKMPPPVRDSLDVSVWLHQIEGTEFEEQNSYETLDGDGYSPRTP